MAKKVIVYSTPTCPWCAKVKEFLKRKKVEFEEKNVADDAEARKEMIDKSGQMGVPVVMIDSLVIVGFNHEALEKALK